MSTPSQARLQALPPELGNTMRLQLSVTDPEVITALSEKPEGRERERYALTAMRIGVAAMRQASGMIDAESIKREGGNLVKELRQSVESHRSELENNVAKVLESFLDPEKGQLSQRIKRLINPEDGELARLIEDELTGDNSALARQLASQMGEDSPLLKMLDPDNKQGVLALMEGQIKTLLDEQREAVLGEFSTDSEDSALSRLIKKVTELQQATTNQLSLDEDDSALSRLKSVFEKAQKDIHKQLSLDEEGSSLKQIQSTISDQLEKMVKEQHEFQTAMQTTIAEALTRKKERAKTTSHGIDFEEIMHPALLELAGDAIVQRCGAVVGNKKNCRRGDFYIEMDADHRLAGARVVVEAKEDQSFARYDTAAEYLEEAIENRGAQVGVFVMSAITVRQLIDHDWHSPLVRNGNMIFVVWDYEDEDSIHVLAAAVSLAKAMLVELSIDVEEDELKDLNLDEIQTAILDIETQVARFKKVNGWCETIEDRVNDIREELRKTAKKLRVDAGRLDKNFSSLRRT